MKGKYYHFALRCVDAFILYDTLYWDHSVPTPLKDESTSVWYLDEKLFGFKGLILEKKPLSDRSIDTYFSSRQQEFYEELFGSGAIRPIPIDQMLFWRLFEEAVDDLNHLKKTGLNIQSIWQEMKEMVPGLDKRFWLKNPLALEEISIFWRETQATLTKTIPLTKRIETLARSKKSTDFKIYPQFGEEILYKRYPIKHSTHDPWILSSLLCGKLQAVLGVPGVYSTFSFPSSSFITSGQAMLAKQHAIREAFKDILDYYERIIPFQVRIPIPSFSAWCAGTGQQSRRFSNLEILERALRIRSNKHIKSFRSKFWEIVGEILSTSEGQSQNDIQSKVDKALSQSLSNLIAVLPTSWKSRVKSSTLTALIGAPISFLTLNPVIGAASTAGVELLRQALLDRRRESEYGWLFFLHEEISGYS